MRRQDWLTGTLIVTTVASGPKRGMKLDLLLPLRGKSTVSIQLRDEYRFELSGKGGVGAFRIELDTTESADIGERCPLLSRAQEVLGEGVVLHRSTCEVWFPDPVPHSTAYLGFCIRQPGVAGENVAKGSDVAWYRAPHCIYLEARRGSLELGKLGARSLYFLTTRQQANDRIEAIARKYGLFDRDDEASTEALTKLYLGIISGADSPLLTEWLEDDNDE